MTRAALTKLLILVILAFIICLPEFFTLYRVSKVNFLCLPYRPCERGNPVKTGENGKIAGAESRMENMCDPSQTPEREKWEQGCAERNQSIKAKAAADSRGGGGDPEKSWFMCVTDMDMEDLHKNISYSDLKVHFELSVELQLRDADNLNLTLYGLNNDSSLYLHPPEEERERQDDDDEGQDKAFYCCLPTPPASESASQSRCLLWLANQTVSTATAKEKLPWKRTQKDEWRCMFRVLWLVLLCVVLLTIVTTVIGQVYWGRCSHKTPMVHPVGYNIAGRQLNDNINPDSHFSLQRPTIKEFIFNSYGETTDIIMPRGMVRHSDGSRTWPELSPIQEVESQDDIETLLDGSIDQCYTANLHHRSHPSSSSLTEEPAWWQKSSQRRTDMDSKCSGET